MNPPTANLAFELVEGIILVVHGRAAPSEEEWDAFIEFGLDHHRAFLGGLVLTPGAGPSATQRRRQADRFAAAHVKPTWRTAIVSDSAILRGIATALTWVTSMELKAFGSKEQNAAFAYLEVSGERRIALKSAITRLRARVEH